VVFQVRMPEPQLDLADVATSKKVHARESMTTKKEQCSFKVGDTVVYRPSDRGEALGEWLQVNVTQTAIASYVAPILVNEGYAHRVTKQTKIKFKGLRELCGG